MQYTLQFFSVSQQQVQAVLDALDNEGVKPVSTDTPTNLNGTLVGTTTLGDVAGTYDFSVSSGQLTVVITQKPALLLVDTIRMKINDGLAKALPYVDPTTETPVPAEIVVPASVGDVAVPAIAPVSGLSWKKRKKLQTARAAHGAVIETPGERVEERTGAFVG